MAGSEGAGPAILARPQRGVAPGPWPEGPQEARRRRGSLRAEPSIGGVKRGRSPLSPPGGTAGGPNGCPKGPTGLGPAALGSYGAAEMATRGLSGPGSSPDRLNDSLRLLRTCT